MDPASKITEIKGVGQRRAKLYEKLGIYTVGDLLEHYPRGYIDLTGPLTIGAAAGKAPLP